MGTILLGSVCALISCFAIICDAPDGINKSKNEINLGVENSQRFKLIKRVYYRKTPPDWTTLGFLPLRLANSKRLRYQFARKSWIN